MARGVLDSAWTRRGGEHGAARTGPEGQRRAGNGKRGGRVAGARDRVCSFLKNARAKHCASRKKTRARCVRTGRAWGTGRRRGGRAGERPRGRGPALRPTTTVSLGTRSATGLHTRRVNSRRKETLSRRPLEGLPGRPPRALPRALPRSLRVSARGAGSIRRARTLSPARCDLRGVLVLSALFFSSTYVDTQRDGQRATGPKAQA